MKKIYIILVVLFSLLLSACGKNENIKLTEDGFQLEKADQRCLLIGTDVEESEDISKGILEIKSLKNEEQLIEVRYAGGDVNEFYSEVPPGEYLITYQLEGYSPVATTIIIDKEPVNRVDLLMERLEPDESSEDEQIEVEPSFGWVQNDDQWYYFLEDGTNAEGWLLLDEIWYWFDSDGAMATGIREIDGEIYCFQDDGAMITGWFDQDGIRYYMLESGAAAKGWLLIDDVWYWFDEDGSMVSDVTLEIDGVEYSFDTDGAWIAD